MMITESGDFLLLFFPTDSVSTTYTAVCEQQDTIQQSIFFLLFYFLNRWLTAAAAVCHCQFITHFKYNNSSSTKMSLKLLFSFFSCPRSW
jgi:hypothetical protein